MFERFTLAARQVVVCAQEEARTFGHPWLGTEHLLLGVLAEPQAPGVSVLAELGITLDTGRAALRQLVGRGGLSESDADALRTLGIDLDEVRRRVEASFGPGALDYPWLSLNVPRLQARCRRRGGGTDANKRMRPGISRSCRGRNVRSNVRSARLSPSATSTSVWSTCCSVCSTRKATRPWKCSAASTPTRKSSAPVYSPTSARRHNPMRLRSVSGAGRALAGALLAFDTASVRPFG